MLSIQPVMLMAIMRSDFQAGLNDGVMTCLLDIETVGKIDSEQAGYLSGMKAGNRARRTS